MTGSYLESKNLLFNELKLWSTAEEMGGGGGEGRANMHPIIIVRSLTLVHLDLLESSQISYP